MTINVRKVDARPKNLFLHLTARHMVACRSDAPTLRVERDNIAMNTNVRKVAAYLLKVIIQIIVLCTVACRLDAPMPKAEQEVIVMNIVA